MILHLIDEFPALSIAAACGKGKMIMKGLRELRYKESDRFKSISEGLRKCRCAKLILLTMIWR